MARMFTTAKAELYAKSWFHDITLAAGLRTKDFRPANKRDSFFPDYVQSAKNICDEVVQRNFNNIDKDIRNLSRYYVRPTLDPNDNTRRSAKPEVIAKYIVYMAKELNLYWDDTVRTPYEIDEFKRSLLGSAVYQYNQYISAIKDPKSSKSTKTGGNSNSNSSSSSSAGQPPKNGYKQSGPQSGNVRDLHGQPGVKAQAEGPYVYRIMGENPQSKNVPTVVIKPLSSSGATGNTNKIFISSGNGYTDCTCYFDDITEATTFMNKVINSGRVPANVSNLHIVKRAAEANGYFIVGTEFGECAISAKTLNEAFEKGLEPEDGGWSTAMENLSEEARKDIHVWMRRD